MSTTTETPQNTLDAWLAHERAVRARLDAGAGPGVARPEQVAGKTGLQVMQGLLNGELPYAHMAKTLDFLLIEVGPAQLDDALRQLTDQDLEETASTRLLVAAGRLVASGLPLNLACRAAIVDALTDDLDTVDALQEVVRAVVGDAG